MAIVTLDPYDGDPVGAVSVGRFWSSRPNSDRVELAFMDVGGKWPMSMHPSDRPEPQAPAMHRLTPEQARDLAKMLLAEAAECEGQSPETIPGYVEQPTGDSDLSVAARIVTFRVARYARLMELGAPKSVTDRAGAMAMAAADRLWLLMPKPMIRLQSEPSKPGIFVFPPEAGSAPDPQPEPIVPHVAPNPFVRGARVKLIENDNERSGRVVMAQADKERSLVEWSSRAYPNSGVAYRTWEDWSALRLVAKPDGRMKR